METAGVESGKGVETGDYAAFFKELLGNPEMLKTVAEAVEARQKAVEEAISDLSQVIIDQAETVGSIGEQLSEQASDVEILDQHVGSLAKDLNTALTAIEDQAELITRLVNRLAELERAAIKAKLQG